MVKTAGSDDPLPPMKIRFGKAVTTPSSRRNSPKSSKTKSPAVTKAEARATKTPTSTSNASAKSVSGRSESPLSSLSSVRTTPGFTAVNAAVNAAAMPSATALATALSISIPIPGSDVHATPLSRSESPLSSARSTATPPEFPATTPSEPTATIPSKFTPVIPSGFTAVNASILSRAMPLPVDTTLSPTEARPGSSRSDTPGPSEEHKGMIWKHYPHPGFAPGTFSHSNYEYRQYKTSPLPDFKPYPHPGFPEGTFSHSNYGYRGNKSGLGGPPITAFNNTETLPEDLPSFTPQLPQREYIPPPPRQQLPPREPPQPRLPQPQYPQQREYRPPPEYEYHPRPEAYSQLGQLGSYIAPEYHPPPLPKKYRREPPQPLQTTPPKPRRRSVATSVATSGSPQLVSPPITPETHDRPSLAENQQAQPSVEGNVDAIATVGPTLRSSVKKKVRSASPVPLNPYDDPDDEFSRPSVMTLRPWQNDDGTTSMVQDYRLFMGGQLHVGKVETEW